MIAGVRLRDLVRHADERGSFTELLRRDWPEHPGFGQASITVNLPGVIRAWHWHRRQTDIIVVVQGAAKVALYDAREGSPTRGEVAEWVLGDEHLALVAVPPGVYHGYMTVGAGPALIVNFPDQLYDLAAPDEERVPHDTPAVPYLWNAPSR